MRYKVVIVDDEAPICDEIEYLLKQYVDIEICAKFSRAADALAFLVEHSIDILFLDIQMPGLSGLELAQKLKQLSRPPLIVFVTAFTEHALEAFATSAVGYLTKPIEEDRLAEVLRKIRSFSLRSSGEAQPALCRICVLEKGNIVPLDPKDIVFVQVNEKDVFVHTAENKQLCPLSLKEVEELLEEQSFLRVHRQYLVNLAEIREIVPWFHGSFLLRMKNGHEVPVSRNKAKALKQAFGF